MLIATNGDELIISCRSWEINGQFHKKRSQTRFLAPQDCDSIWIASLPTFEWYWEFELIQFFTPAKPFNVIQCITPAATLTQFTRTCTLSLAPHVSIWWAFVFFHSPRKMCHVTTDVRVEAPTPRRKWPVPFWRRTGEDVLSDTGGKMCPGQAFESRGRIGRVMVVDGSVLDIVREAGEDEECNNREAGETSACIYFACQDIPSKQEA
ncbi:hypothetical protein WG66_007609 [Moniliophthora roreri]|nr:hypothetical protein WG66_007609 [Moniliophthora roreri]